MSVDITQGKSPEYVERYELRQNVFYSQTTAENKARLTAKFPSNPDLVDELAFIQAEMILRGSG